MQPLGVGATLTAKFADNGWEFVDDKKKEIMGLFIDGQYVGEFYITKRRGWVFQPVIWFEEQEYSGIDDILKVLNKEGKCQKK